LIFADRLLALIDAGGIWNGPSDHSIGKYTLSGASGRHSVSMDLSLTDCLW